MSSLLKDIDIFVQRMSSLSKDIDGQVKQMKDRISKPGQGERLAVSHNLYLSLFVISSPSHLWQV